MNFGAWTSLLLVPILSKILLGIEATAEEDENSSDLLDSADYDERILKGQPVNPPHSRPYIVQVEAFRKKTHKPKRYVIPAAIYDQWTIITAGLLIKNAKKIFAGKYYLEKHEDSQQERSICLISNHPKAGSDHVKESFDYGVIHLSQPLVFNEFVQPAVFLNYGDSSSNGCKISGWGATKKHDSPSAVLREGPVNILGPKSCHTKHSTLICISDGACNYDSGAPVTCRSKSGIDEVVGFVAKTTKHCKNTVAASMSKMNRDWLDKAIQEGIKKCRGGSPPPTPSPPKPPPPTPAPPPPPGDCCNNGGTINGVESIPHSRPFIVQIHSKGSQQITLGVIVNAYTILTSAHKLQDILKVRAGKHLFGKYEGTQQTRTSCSVSKHANLDKPQNAFGYGLIHLNDPFVLNEYVSAIGFAPEGFVPKDECSIVGWQGNSAETVLREQLVKFKDPSKCENVHETITCVEGGACLHDWGSPVICSEDSKIFLHAIASSADAYCKHGILASIPAIPKSWLATELRNSENTCGQSLR